MGEGVGWQVSTNEREALGALAKGVVDKCNVTWHNRLLTSFRWSLVLIHVVLLSNGVAPDRHDMGVGEVSGLDVADIGHDEILVVALALK